MEISIRHIGNSLVKASNIIEMTVSDWSGNHAYKYKQNNE